MKRHVFLLVFLNLCLVAFSQKNTAVICPYDFTFEISMQKNWGYYKPVVLSVEPNTPAEDSGLCINDIIEKINGKSTLGETYETIINWLKNSNTPVQITISNLKERNKNLALDKFCRLNNSLIERDLASIYSFYSLEDVQTRAFTCPFKTTVNRESNLILYSSFGFADEDPANLSLEKTINAAIRKVLEQKGLKYSEKNPDLIVQTYYSYTANPNFLANSQTDKFPVACRYNVNTKAMENLPVYYNPLINTNKAKLFLKLGIRLLDNTEKDKSIVWECEANELLQSEYSLANYAEFHIPLMFMQYPYPKSFETARFYYSRSKYNYTGILYNMDNLKEISEVDPSSPAAIAGIQAGDIIEKINGIKFISNAKAADNNYKQFIYKTMSLRDQNTQFTNADGFTQCMYWDKINYAQIYDEFRKPEYSTAFSYLFYFEPYTNLSGTNIVTFSIKRGKQKAEVKIRPAVFLEELFENR